MQPLLFLPILTLAQAPLPQGEVHRVFEPRLTGRLEQRGGDRPVADAIARGLDWLRRHQATDGHWSASGFDERCPAGDACPGAGKVETDVAATSVALLAFLGDGSTMRRGPDKALVKSATIWLKDRMGGDGGFLSAASGGAVDEITQALATLALVEVHHLSGYRVLRPYAQKATNNLLRRQAHDGAFGSGQAQPLATATASVTLWTAALAGLRVPEDSISRALAPLARRTDIDNATSAAILLTRKLTEQAGGEKEADREIALLARRLVRGRDSDGTKHDLLELFFGAQAMFQMGGEHWTRWRGTAERGLLASQASEGHAAGSWQPEGARDRIGGRVWSTALAVLALEAHYRYRRLEELSKQPRAAAADRAVREPRVDVQIICRKPGDQVVEDGRLVRMVGREILYGVGPARFDSVAKLDEVANKQPKPVPLVIQVARDVLVGDVVPVVDHVKKQRLFSGLLLRVDVANDWSVPRRATLALDLAATSRPEDIELALAPSAGAPDPRVPVLDVDRTGTIVHDGKRVPDVVAAAQKLADAGAKSVVIRADKWAEMSHVAALAAALLQTKDPIRTIYLGVTKPK